jgi:mannosyltransferase OCH1-like enzyme
MIPKIIHHVWLGPNEIPESEQKFIVSWKKLHPDYYFMLWKDSNINKLNISNGCKQAMEKAGERYACKADIVRYIAVHNFGGFYVDTDIECYNNIDNIFSDDIEFIGLRPHSGNWITNAFFGSIPKHKILELAIDTISKNPNNGSLNPFGPSFLTRNVIKYASYDAKMQIDDLNSHNIKIMKPLFWSNRNKDAYCRHYFKASWIKKPK